MTPAVYRPDEVAALLQVSLSTVHNLVRRGVLPLVLKDPLRISRDAVDAMLDGAAQSTPVQPAKRRAPRPLPGPKPLDIDDLRAERDALSATRRAARR